VLNDDIHPEKATDTYLLHSSSYKLSLSRLDYNKGKMSSFLHYKEQDYFSPMLKIAQLYFLCSSA